MQANIEEVVALLELAKVDRVQLKAKKQLEELPQRATILAARKKRDAVLQKQESVAKMRKDAERQLSLVTDEDALLAQKQEEVQRTIDSCRGDFRSVEAHTKELNGIAKCRSALEEQLGEVDARLTKVAEVQAQIDALLATIEGEEAAAVKSFREQGGALQAAIGKAQAERDAIAAGIRAELIERYDKAAKQCGGVAIGALQQGHCSICRSSIDEAHLIELRANRPLGTCPSCHRLLAVEVEE